MSFLHQLKQQAQSLQSEQAATQQNLEAQSAATQVACQRVWHYLDDLHRQLNVIQPPALAVSLDGRTAWPPMRLTDFRFDARQKRLRDREVFDYLAMGWALEPQAPVAGRGQVKVNFPPDLERVERRLRVGSVPHERIEQRHPQTNGLLAIVFEHAFAARAGIRVTADHDAGALDFRLTAVQGLEVVNARYRAEQVSTGLLDELAKLIVGQVSRFA